MHTSLTDVPEIFGFERHSIVAGIFFIILGFISLSCFTQTLENMQITIRGKKRNNIFRVCGWIMLISVASMTIYFVSDSVSSMLGGIPFIYIMETAATWAFGISWLTAGETIYPEGEHYIVSGYKVLKHIVHYTYINSEK